MKPSIYQNSRNERYAWYRLLIGNVSDRQLRRGELILHLILQLLSHIRILLNTNECNITAKQDWQPNKLLMWKVCPRFSCNVAEDAWVQLLAQRQRLQVTSTAVMIIYPLYAQTRIKMRGSYKLELAALWNNPLEEHLEAVDRSLMNGTFQSSSMTSPIFPLIWREMGKGILTWWN